MSLTVADLPTLNAALNATSAVLLVLGWGLILRRRIDAHRRAMLSAFVCSCVFLTSYLIYHFQVGSVKFQGTGTVRTVYLAILLSHTVLAAAVPVLATITLSRALARRFDKHRRVARWTLPIWLYVSVTGVVVYWMLYQMRF
jgi:putative membrane protein